MARYLARTCPKCGDYLGVVVPEPEDPREEIPIEGRCVRCGFRLNWRLIIGRRAEGFRVLRQPLDFSLR